MKMLLTVSKGDLSLKPPRADSPSSLIHLVKRVLHSFHCIRDPGRRTLKRDALFIELSAGRSLTGEVLFCEWINLEIISYAK
jgi:hypothetical protein